MKSLAEVLRLKKTIRVMGFDDAPFESERGSPVQLSGIVCAQTRFEGMVWGQATKDGDDATEVIANMVLGSKFHRQIHVVLLDGLAIGGFNLIDLPELVARVERPCICVMRRRPNMEAIHKALDCFEDKARRVALIERAGKVYERSGFVYQVCGVAEDHAAQALVRLTDQGHVPEALRLAHLIGAAIMTGESSSRA